MAYAIRIQTTGQRVLSCECGAISTHRVRPQSHKIRCPTCHLTLVLGTVVYRVTNAPHDRPPADRSIPGHITDEVSSPCNAFDNGTADEVTVQGGIWRSAEPCTIESPSNLTQLWRHKLSNCPYLAHPVAMGTRYVVQPLSGTIIDRYIVSAVEFTAECERIQ